MTKKLEKQDCMLSRTARTDSMLEKQDSMLDLQRKTIDIIKLDGEKTRDSISIHVSNDLADNAQEIIHNQLTRLHMFFPFYNPD
jgi:uncharacterized transporter YbjL